MGLSWEEFRTHLQNDKVKAYFQALELDVSQAHSLFRLLDVDGSHEVGLEEFLEGCLRLKGGARSIDVNMIMYENKLMIAKFNECFARVHKMLTKIELNLGLPSLPFLS